MSRRHLTRITICFGLIAPLAHAETVPGAAGDEPIVVDGRLVFPEGAAIPRSLTEVERRYGARPSPADLLATPPPEGPVHCPAEYEPMDGIIVAWEGSASWRAILAMMAAGITTTGDANLYVSVDSAAEETTAFAEIAAAGADMTRVSSVITATDTIWVRDYGPRYIYEGDCRAIVDHTYNRPRPADNDFPIAFGAVKRHQYYDLPLIHGGGNYHLDGLSRSYATRLINNENPSLTEAEIQGLWLSYQNLDTTLFDPFPTAIDSTQHLDMWMQVVADDAVMISDWPSNPGSTQDVICDAAAITMASRGYTVHRLPARSVGGTHYTYTNVVMVNNLVMIPSYTNATVAPHNDEALLAWQTAVPTKTVVQIPAQNIVTASGVLHCIVMHVPKHRGGVNPTVRLRSHRECQNLTPGTDVDILWLSDDDKRVDSVDIRLSTDGGASFPDVIALAAPDTGSYTWRVPPLSTAEARIQIVAWDADRNSGSDQSPENLIIGSPGGTGPAPPGTLFAVTAGPGVTFTILPSSDAAAYNVYHGLFRVFDVAVTTTCHRDQADPDFVVNPDTSVSYTLTSVPDSRWYLVSGSDCAGESALSQLPVGLCGAIP